MCRGKGKEVAEGERTRGDVSLKKEMRREEAEDEEKKQKKFRCNGKCDTRD